MWQMTLLHVSSWPQTLLEGDLQRLHLAAEEAIKLQDTSLKNISLIQGQAVDAG